MRILLVAESWDLSDGPYMSSGPSYVRALKDLGNDVHVVDNKRNYLQVGGRTMWEYPGWMIRTRLCRLNDRIVNMKVRRRAYRVDPELILFVKCENVHWRTISYLRDRTKAVLFNWYHDNPFHYSTTSMSALRAIELFDGYAIWSRRLLPVLYDLGCKRVEYLPFYYDRFIHPLDAQQSDEDWEKYKCDISFIGAWSPRREEIFGVLTDLDFKIWGHGWERLGKDSPLRKCYQGRHAVGQEYGRIVRASKIHVNAFNTVTQGANNLRTFEVTALGTLLITEYTEEVGRELFSDGVELVCYRGREELRRHVEYYLKHDEDRLRIARAGQSRTLKEHTLENRLKQLLRTVEDIRVQRRIGK